MAKTAPRTGPKTRDELLDLIEKSGLYGESQLAEVRALVADCEDSEQALERLASQTRLTTWQADQLRAGQFVLKLGDYQLVQEYETWEFGRALLAIHTTSSQRVTLKLLSSRFTQDEQLWKEFVADLRKLARLNHPHLAAFRDLAKSGNRQFLVGELEDTPTIEQRLASWGSPGSVAQAQMLMQAADALHALHERDVVHGCLTARRVRLDEDGCLRIYDVGFQRLVSRAADGAIAGSSLAPPADWPHKDQPVLRDLFSVGALIEKLRIDAPVHRQPPAWWTKDAGPEAAQELQKLCRRMQGVEGEPPPDAAAVLRACREWAQRFGIEMPKLSSAKQNHHASKNGDSSTSDGPYTTGIMINTERRRKRRTVEQVADAPAPRKRGKFLIICSAAALLVIAVLGSASYFTSRPRQTAASEATNDAAKKSTTKSAAQDGPDVLETNPVIADSADATAEKGSIDVSAGTSTNNNSISSTNAAQGAVATADVSQSTTTTNPDASAQTPAENQASLPMPNTTDSATANSAAANSAEPMPNTDAAAGNTTPSPPPGVPDAAATTQGEQTAATTTDATTPGGAPAETLVMEDPYRELPEAVALPDRAMSAGAEATPLAPIHVDDKTPCYLALVGGDRIAKSPRAIKIENAAGGTMERMWDVFAIDGTMTRTLIAQFALQGSQLSFHWLAEAKDIELASGLENCLLQITINEQKAFVALRQPVLVKPLVLDLDRGTIAGKFQIPNLPDTANCRFEIVQLEGPFPKHALFPPESVPAAKGEQWVLLGEPKAEQVLALHAETNLKRVHQVTITAFNQHGDDPDPSWFKDKTRRMVKGQRNQFAKDVQAAILRASAELKRYEGADETKLTEQDKQSRNLAKVTVERATALATQLQKLEELCKALNDVGKIHFHVVYEVEGHPIELLRTASQ